MVTTRTQHPCPRRRRLDTGAAATSTPSAKSIQDQISVAQSQTAQLTWLSQLGRVWWWASRPTMLFYQHVGIRQASESSATAPNKQRNAIAISDL